MGDKREALPLGKLPEALDAAGYLRLPRHPGFVLAGAKRGMFPAHERGGVWFFYREDLLAIADGMHLPMQGAA